MHNSVKTSSVSRGKPQTCRAELGQYPLLINIQKQRPPRPSYHYKALKHQEMSSERSYKALKHQEMSSEKSYKALKHQEMSSERSYKALKHQEMSSERSYKALKHQEMSSERSYKALKHQEMSSEKSYKALKHQEMSSERSYKALKHQEMSSEKSPLSQLVLRLSALIPLTQSSPNTAPPKLSESTKLEKNINRITSPIGMHKQKHKAN